MTVPDGDDDLQPAVVLGEPQSHDFRVVKGDKFNPEPGREYVRGIIAVGSFVLFAVVVLIILWGVATGHRTWEEMEGVTAGLLPAVTSVVSGSVGFYFGTRSAGVSR